MRGFRTSSGRRGASRTGASGTIVWIAAICIVIVVVIGSLRAGRDAAPPAPAPPPRETPSPTVAPSPSATPTPELVERSTSEWIPIPPAASPTPTVPPPLAVPTRPPPSPTPAPSGCVRFGYTTAQVMAPNAHVLVEIDAVNRCGRDLEPSELWFRITGYRDGSPAQTVHGQPFHRLRRHGSVQVAIGLPGSADWYDRIEVTLLDRAP